LEVGVLLGLMCKYASEECTFMIYSDSLPATSVKLAAGTILDNMATVLRVASATSTHVCQVCFCRRPLDWTDHCECTSCGFGCEYLPPSAASATAAAPLAGQEAPGFPAALLSSLLRDRVDIDNILVLGSNAVDPPGLRSFLSKYRRLVNPDLLNVNVDLSGKRVGVSAAAAATETHPNDVYIAGYSDQLLRFVAERGDGGGQVDFVDNIDKLYRLEEPASHKHSTPKYRPAPATVDDSTTAIPRRPFGQKGTAAQTAEIATELAATAAAAAAAAAALPPLPPSGLAPVARSGPRVARIFISSTFRDMHGERDLLTRFVLPELRARGKRFGIDVCEVDLRWGLTEAAAARGDTLSLCLDEVSASNFFVGLLGERYGHVPDLATAPSTARYDWLRAPEHDGKSLTELEMTLAALGAPASVPGRAVFLLRDALFAAEHVPAAHREWFAAESPAAAARMSALRAAIVASGHPVLDGYAATWGGLVRGSPVAAGLDALGVYVLDTLWAAISTAFAADDAVARQLATVQAHDLAATGFRCGFVGRAKILAQLRHFALDSAAAATAAAHSAAHNGTTATTGPGLTAGNTPPAVLCVTGPSGCGKTALVAEFVGAVGGTHVLAHFVGAVALSRNIRSMLARLCRELVRRFALTVDVPAALAELLEVFPVILAAAKAQCAGPLVLVVDAVDGLDTDGGGGDPLSPLQWLPRALPADVRVVLSLGVGRTLDAALVRGDAVELRITPLALWERGDLVRSYLARYGKRLGDGAFGNQLQVWLLFL
jgi:telomerase protein component 1